MKINDLRAKRSKIVKEMRTMAEGDLSPEQEIRFDDLKRDLETIEKSIERAEYLEELERRADPAEDNPEYRKEVREYSLTRAIAGAAGLDVDYGREREISAELAKRAGKPAKGIYAPMSVFQVERRDAGISTTTPVAGPGSNIVPVDYRPGQFIDLLRSKLIINRLGARVLSGLTGNVTIPRLQQSATGGWVAEDSALTPTDMQFGALNLTPKHAGALIELTRNMIQQSSPDIEQLVRADFAAVLARAVDRVALQGGGPNEPSGIMVTNGINEVDVSGDWPGGWSWPKILEFIEKVESDDSTGSAFCTTPARVKMLRSTFKTEMTDGSVADSVTLMEGPNSLAGYPCVSSTIVPTGQLIFGNWSDLLVGYWSQLDLLVNPYADSVYSKGNILVRSMLTMDVGVRHPQSFCVADLTGE